MHCDEVRTILLDYGWGAEERRRAMLLLRHLETCDACRGAFADFDLLRRTLRPDDPDQPVAEPSLGWDAFLKRLEEGPTRNTLRLRLRPSGGRAAALAACVVLALCAFQLGRRAGSDGTIAQVPPASTKPSTSDSGPSEREANVVASLTPTPADAQRQAVAFEQVSEVFDRKASWLMTSAGGTSDVGLASDAVPAGRKLLMLRLAVLNEGVVLSSADLVIVPGQSAKLTLPTTDGGVLKYRIGTSAGEPTELTLWLEVHPPLGGNTLAALATNIRVRPGERVAAGEMTTTAGRYELEVGFAQAQASPAPAAATEGKP